nr:hypothetical protein [uncultured Rhodoferax sp.]
MKHTQGKWTAGVGTVDGKECFLVGLLGTSKALAVTGHVGAKDEDESIANAYRIEACINACNGISTEKLNGGWIDTVINPYATRLEGEAKVLRDLLTLTLGPLTSTLQDSADTTESEMLADLIGKIESASGSVPVNNSHVLAMELKYEH